MSFANKVRNRSAIRVVKIVIPRKDNATKRMRAAEDDEPSLPLKRQKVEVASKEAAADKIKQVHDHTFREHGSFRFLDLPAGRGTS